MHLPLLLESKLHQTMRHQAHSSMARKAGQEPPVKKQPQLWCKYRWIPTAFLDEFQAKGQFSGRNRCCQRLFASERYLEDILAALASCGPAAAIAWTERKASGRGEPS